MYNILNNYGQFNTDFIQFKLYTIPYSIVCDQMSCLKIIWQTELLYIGNVVLKYEYELYVQIQFTCAPKITQLLVFSKGDCFFLVSFTRYSIRKILYTLS